MSVANLAQYKRYVDFTTDSVNYSALFLQHPGLWIRSISRRIRDLLLGGHEAAAFVFTELHNELQKRVDEAGLDEVALRLLHRQIDEAKAELDIMVDKEKALTGAKGSKLKKELVNLSAHMAETLNNLVEKMSVEEIDKPEKS